MVGLIDPLLDPRKVVQDAADDARFLCETNYCMAPRVEIVVPQQKDQPHISPIFPYAPSHLYHMLFELLKVWLISPT